MNRAFKRPLLFTALALCLPLAAHAADNLPEARSLLDKHIEAMGGEAQVLKGAQGTAKGSFGMPAAGISAPMTIWMDGQGNLATEVELPGMGTIRSGVNGETVWGVDPFQGPRILEGLERAEQLDNASIDGSLRKDSMVASMQTTGRAEYDGRACYKVELKWRSGRDSWDCYAIDDGLLLASGGKSHSPMGEVEVVNIVKRYAELSGLRMPVLSEMQMMGQTQVISIDSFDPTAPDAAVFALPAPIKALAGE